MKATEEIIQEILDEQHECRWMDTSDLEVYLRKVATEQKSIDIDKACEWLKGVNEGIATMAKIEGKAPCIIDVDMFRKDMEE